MTDEDETVRLWLVEREVDSRNLLTLTYATREGDRVYRRQQSASVATPGSQPTAGREAAPADLRPVADPETRDRYAAEAARMAERHDPGDQV
jgi:hypothetical protein